MRPILPARARGAGLAPGAKSRDTEPEPDTGRESLPLPLPLAVPLLGLVLLGVLLRTVEMDWRDGPLRIRMLERCHGAGSIADKVPARGLLVGEVVVLLFLAFVGGLFGELGMLNGNEVGSLA